MHWFFSSPSPSSLTLSLSTLHSRCLGVHNQVAGKHNPIYEAYYKIVDPKGIGTIEAVAAAKFLKKSGLSDVVLSRVSGEFINKIIVSQK